MRWWWRWWQLPVLGVAMVSPLRQSGLGLFPMASALPQVSKVVMSPSKGSVSPGLGARQLAQECCLVLGLAPPSAAFGPSDHPSAAESGSGSPICGGSALFAFLPLLGLLRLGVFLGFWGLHLLCLLGFLPGWRPHGSSFSLIRLRVLGVSSVMPLGLQVCLDPPPAL